MKNIKNPIGSFMNRKSRVRGIRSAVFFIPAFLFTFLGCGNRTDVASPPAKGQFFDLTGFFEKEVDRLSTFPKVKKLVVVAGKEESKILENVDFNKELDVFSSQDINRPAWSDKYSTDSIFNDRKELTRLRYTAMDKSLKTRLLEIDFKQNEVVKITLENKTEGAVANTSQILIYEPATGYSIQSQQKVTFAGEGNFFVRVVFL